MKEQNPAIRLRLTKESRAYIERYAEENNIVYNNRTINKIIEEHKQMKEEQTSSLASSISQEVSNQINKEIRRIRLGTNNTDRNTQILLELLNGMFVNQSIDDIVTTADMETNAYRTATQHVQKRIEHQQQRRADAKHRNHL
ncbi:hypothetical protein [Salibacterium qingdaonense]|uniref:Uncharacterized protein n=1 Tax=Salibacterium qingdaonense TaxID=266892 RepID=A0A1I4R5J3_9BACI|nr:hypothetical protein [Salibacterium qingdaonense]SFM47572.1 hypothetical protein SAMN04488054_1652 [Salibacterium qingdaonense]